MFEKLSCGRLSLWTVLACLTGLGLVSCGSPPPKQKMVILGLDGLDPQITRRLLAEGKLPGFERLKSMGGFSELGTSTPPESPVAWSTFITGLDAGGHGVFDFIHRDPETLTPYLSTTATEASSWEIPVGKWIIPLWPGKVKLLRGGRAFWELLEDSGVPCTIVRIPANYPPTDSPARQLSGMGTPDLEGTYGTFSYYTDEPAGSYGDISGGRVFYVKVVEDRVDATLPGPLNSFLRTRPQASIPFQVFLDADQPVAKIVVQGREIILKTGEWSDWAPVSFPLLTVVASADGIVRFHLMEVRPDFKLYVSPVNIDPSSPVLPISQPSSYAHDLSRQLGRFSTLGIPEDTKALSSGIFRDADFLEQSRLLHQEELRLLDYELRSFKSGVLFFYSGRADQLQHMFWRAVDPSHPAHRPGDERYADTIERVYQEMDGLVGYALDRVPPGTTVVALSDHGFVEFARAFSLNNWLRDQGFACEKKGAGGGYLEGFDWARTRAYGLGFAGLYVNLKGREKNGVVEPADRAALLQEITRRLLEIRDPVTGSQVVTHVYQADLVYSGPFARQAPDLIVGYNRGYRASWESVVGLFSPELLSDNKDPWSGDHLMDPELVPGILFVNRPIKTGHPSLRDLAPTILEHFGVAKDPAMKGKPVF